MTLLKYTAFAIFIACLAYMDHLNDRHPYGIGDLFGIKPSVPEY